MRVVVSSNAKLKLGICTCVCITFNKHGIMQASCTDFADFYFPLKKHNNHHETKRLYKYGQGQY